MYTVGAHDAMETRKQNRWGEAPWRIDFKLAARPIPEEVDFAIVGGGFSGLSTAAWLKQFAPKKTVALFEAESIGAGSSGHTGGMSLGETAAGDLPGLGDVLSGFAGALRDLNVECDLYLPGASELGRADTMPDSPIRWSDSGDLRTVREVPGGTIDPGKMVSGLARAAESLGAMIYENAPVENAAFEGPIRLQIAGKQVRAQRILFATNAQSLELNGLAGRAQPKFTLALATEPLTAQKLEALGLASRKPFYTIDFPYLWGRLLNSDGVIFGSGLVHFKDWRELRDLDVAAGEPRQLMDRLEKRVRALHPVLKDVQVTHRWGGPILVGEDWQPVFAQHPKSSRAIVLGAFSGHGVALSVYLGRWAAEVMLGIRDLPDWGAD
jgi:glycine/D-amino acid oxidase-like deaminating enzyme